MDQGKENKLGIFYSLRQRFWKSKLTKKSCFKNTESKHKIRSESSHSNIVSSTSENNCYRPIPTSSPVKTITSISETALAEHVETLQVSAQKESNTEIIRCSDNVNQIDHTNPQSRIAEVDCSSLSDSEPTTKTSNVPTEVDGGTSLFELSSHKHNVSSVTNVNGDPHQKALSDSNIKTGLMNELLKLTKCGWYWGSISKEEAEEKLTGLPDGAFLLRDSSADHFILTLSFRSYGKTLHTRIEYSLETGMFSFYQQPEERFSTVAILVEHSMFFSRSAVYCYSRPLFPGHTAFPVRLTKPLSRFANVRSLQHLCRFVIRESIRLDNIQKLPLPNKIKDYIEEGYY